MKATRYVVDRPVITVIKVEDTDDLHGVANQINADLHLFPQLKGLPIHAVVNEDKGVVCSKHESAPLASIGDFLCWDEHQGFIRNYVIVPGKGRDELPLDDIPTQLYFTPVLVPMSNQ